MLDYLTRQDIIHINTRTINAHGGNFVPPSNFLHEDAQDYLLASVKSEMFGEA